MTWARSLALLLIGPLLVAACSTSDPESDVVTASPQPSEESEMEESTETTPTPGPTSAPAVAPTAGTDATVSPEPTADAVGSVRCSVGAILAAWNCTGDIYPQRTGIEQWTCAEGPAGAWRCEGDVSTGLLGPERWVCSLGQIFGRWTCEGEFDPEADGPETWACEPGTLLDGWVCSGDVDGLIEGQSIRCTVGAIFGDWNCVNEAIGPTPIEAEVPRSWTCARGASHWRCDPANPLMFALVPIPLLAEPEDET